MKDKDTGRELPNLKIKHVVMPDGFKVNPYDLMGLDIKNTYVDNEKKFFSMIGSKQQIDRYLTKYQPVSERLRTLNSIPKYRVIETTKVEVY